MLSAELSRPLGMDTSGPGRAIQVKRGTAAGLFFSVRKKKPRGCSSLIFFGANFSHSSLRSLSLRLSFRGSNSLIHALARGYWAAFACLFVREGYSKKVFKKQMKSYFRATFCECSETLTGVQLRFSDPFEAGKLPAPLLRSFRGGQPALFSSKSIYGGCIGSRRTAARSVAAKLSLAVDRHLQKIKHSNTVRCSRGHLQRSLRLDDINTIATRMQDVRDFSFGVFGHVTATTGRRAICSLRPAG